MFIENSCSTLKQVNKAERTYLILGYIMLKNFSAYELSEYHLHIVAYVHFKVTLFFCLLFHFSYIFTCSVTQFNTEGIVTPDFREHSALSD